MRFSRKLANNGLRFFHSTNLSASNYQKQNEEVVYKRAADRLSGLRSASISILQTGNTSQEENRTFFKKSTINIIGHQSKLAKQELVLFRPSVLDTELKLRGKNSHHICSMNMPIGRQIYKLARSEI